MSFFIKSLEMSRKVDILSAQIQAFHPSIIEANSICCKTRFIKSRNMSESRDSNRIHLLIINSDSIGREFIISKETKAQVIILPYDANFSVTNLRLILEKFGPEIVTIQIYACMIIAIDFIKALYDHIVQYRSVIMLKFKHSQFNWIAVRYMEQLDWSYSSITYFYFKSKPYQMQDSKLVSQLISVACKLPALTHFVFSTYLESCSESMLAFLVEIRNKPLRMFRIELRCKTWNTIDYVIGLTGYHATLVSLHIVLHGKILWKNETLLNCAIDAIRNPKMQHLVLLVNDHQFNHRDTIIILDHLRDTRIQILELNLASLQSVEIRDKLNMLRQRIEPSLAIAYNMSYGRLKNYARFEVVI